MLQWDIQKQVGSLNNATAIFNARKFDALTPIKIQWLDDGAAKQLSGLHVFLQGAVGQATFKGDQVIMAADATPIYWKDDGSGNQPNGVTIAKLPPQAFAQEGVFAGYFGLENDDGQRLTSVDTWFKVLGGTWNIGLGVKYFISDFDKALANAKGQIDQALSDLRAKYTAQAESAADALSADTQALQRLAASVGQIQSQIDAGNVITRQQFNTEIADLSTSNAAQIKSAFEAIGNGSPQFIDNLTALQTKYPNGNKGLYVTIDTGERYAYLNGSWTSFGQYQAQGISDGSITGAKIADKTIQDNNVKDLNTVKINNSLVQLTDFKRWRASDTSDLIIKNDVLTYNHQRAGDDGIIAYVPYVGGRDLYCAFSLSTTGHGVDLNVMDANGNVMPHSSKGTSSNLNLTQQVIKYSASDFKRWGITNGLVILFAIHEQNKQFSLTNLNISTTNGDQTMSDTLNNLLSDNPLRQIEQVGQIVDDQSITDYTQAPISGLNYVTPNSTSHRDNLLKTIYANVTKAGDYNFSVGMLDQHNLLVNDTSFKLTLMAGYNAVDVEDKQIAVPDKSQVFMDLSGIGTVLKPTDINQKVMPILVQDNAHESTAAGYPGQIFYYTPDYMLPFAYDLIEQGQQQRVAALEKNVSEVSQAVSGLTSKSNELFLIKPNGAKALLGASDTGLFATDVVPKKVTVLGNSLTSEHGGIGMAASDQNHDWYHLISDYILTKNPTAVIKPRFNASSWESATTSVDRQTYFDKTLAPLIDADTDLAIIQLVDNVNTDEKLATFGEDAKTLITNIRTKAPHARVLWVAGWFVDDNKINLIKTACLDRGALFVDITAYKNDAQYKGTMGATRTGVDGTSWIVTNPGEALHPGDLGMKKIAETVEAALNF